MEEKDRQVNGNHEHECQQEKFLRETLVVGALCHGSTVTGKVVADFENSESSGSDDEQRLKRYVSFGMVSR